MKKISILIFCLSTFLTFSNAEVAPISPEELADKSDLIVIGTVNKIETTQEKQKVDYSDFDIPVKYATILIKEVIKGKPASSVIVRYAYDAGMEADVQDPNFEVEKKVLLYLKSNNNDQRDSYSVVYGWSGVGRIYEGKFYHQYFETDFDKYLKELKDHIQRYCSYCKAKLIKVPITYGFPTQEAMDKATRGEIVLGGCLVYDEQPNYAFICPKCKKIAGEYVIEDIESSEATSEHKKLIGNIGSPIIKYDLNGMSDEQIKEYFNQCVSNNLVFLYRGGFAGAYLVEASEMEFAKNFMWVGIGCTGGVLEGYKFNNLMLDYIKENRLSFSRATVDSASYAETIELIKDGKVVAGATAIWGDDDSVEIQNRLFKLSILINQSLRQLSGHDFTNEEFGNFTNKIRVKIANDIKYDMYSLWLVKTDKGKELRISGNNIDHTERAVNHFLINYLHINETVLRDLSEVVDKIMADPDFVPHEALDSLSFDKVDNLVFEQDEMEIRKPLPVPEQRWFQQEKG